MENNLENKLGTKNNEHEQTEDKYPYCIKLPLGGLGAFIGAVSGVVLADKFGIEGYVAKKSLIFGLAFVESFAAMQLAEPIKYVVTKTAEKVRNYWR